MAFIDYECDHSGSNAIPLALLEQALRDLPIRVRLSGEVIAGREPVPAISFDNGRVSASHQALHRWSLAPDRHSALPATDQPGDRGLHHRNGRRRLEVELTDSLSTKSPGRGLLRPSEPRPCARLAQVWPDAAPTVGNAQASISGLVASKKAAKLILEDNDGRLLNQKVPHWSGE